MYVPTLIAMAVLVVLATVCGVAAGMVLVKAAQRRQHSTRAAPKIEPPRIEELIVDVRLADPEGGEPLAWKISARGAEITACLVEQWLSERGLVMSPKGQDFRPAAAVERKAP